MSEKQLETEIATPAAPQTSNELHKSESSEVVVSPAKQSLSDKFTIFASGAALISDGYFNNTMTMVNIVLKKEYPKQYTSSMSTQVSNALLVGEIFGQVTVGLTCDYLGRKFAIILTTLMIAVILADSVVVFGGILATASNGVTING
ncbi:metabolite transport GIT1 protein [Rutstroemia sp. NJR-2017a WRK4]|nr:metabolite transport GIT1 protein [Rutstroemia sp. NJR-2017a WRK4]